MKIHYFLLPSLLIFSIFFTFFCVSSLSQSPTYEDEGCLVCHGKPEIFQITQNGNIRSLYVNPGEWSQDIHHKSTIRCVDCHIDANPFLHFREGFIDANCARCHPEEEEEYQKNIHLTFSASSPNKELPLCFHCHTKHHVLRHDNSSSSTHEKNIGRTCGSCHPEVMVKAILWGTSLGKISGHRKGDISEKFEMRVCLKCHFEDAAHGSKRPYQDFCSRCHDIRSKGSTFMGPTHLKSKRWINLNYTGDGLILLLIAGACIVVGYRSRKGISHKLRAFSLHLKKQEGEAATRESPEQEKGKEG